MMKTESQTDSRGGAGASLPLALSRLEHRLSEASDAVWDHFVDPRDALDDDQGTSWLLLGSGAAGAPGPGSEAHLRDVRQQCRALAVGNEFAINGHENRVSYIVGTGHQYRAVARPGTPPELAAAAQGVLDDFVRVNRWYRRQQEIVRRKDRDGECFLRFFAAEDGIVRLRFVEPDQVVTPAEDRSNPAASLGVLVDPQDVETVLAYAIDGRWVDAAEIQHRKSNVDANAKRGLPLFFPVRKNLRRAEKLLRNMSVVAEIQSAIALIRKHSGGSRAAVEQFVRAAADGFSGPAGQGTPLRQYGPGTILDALAGVDYEFPAAGIDAGRYVTVLQAELRAIASRLVMPEFMLTSDASNANYASTMVAEGPAVKMFQRMQSEMLEEDLEVLRRVLTTAQGGGRLPPGTLEAVDLRGTPPTLAVRNQLHDAQADQILVRSGAMSLETMALRHGLDPDHERRLIAAAGARP